MQILKTECFDYTPEAMRNIDDNIQLYELEGVINDLDNITPEELETLGYSIAPVYDRFNNIDVRSSIRSAAGTYQNSTEYEVWLEQLEARNYYPVSSDLWPAPEEFYNSMFQLASDIEEANLNIKCCDFGHGRNVGMITPLDEGNYYTDVALAYIIAGYLPPRMALDYALQQEQTAERAEILNNAASQAADHLESLAKKFRNVSIAVTATPRP